MDKKIREIIDENLKDECEYHSTCVEHAYIHGFLIAYYTMGKITEKEMDELYNKYTDTNY